MTSISAVLRAADARLTPETWTQQVCLEHMQGKECAYLAIDAVTRNGQQRRAALAVFARVVSGTEELIGIWLWNDRADTTLADVHAAFSAAVAIAQSQEQPVREEVPCG